MTIWIGVDEAGYGPNLGPLLISATVWQTDVATGDELFDRVRQDLAALPGVDGRASRVPLIGDSKQVYHPARGIAGLERGVLGALRTISTSEQTLVTPDSWRTIWSRFDPNSMPWLQTIPWYCCYDSAVPIDATMAELDSVGEQLARSFQHHRVVLRTIRSKTIFPEQFNRDVQRWGSKGAALTRWTLQLVSDLLAEFAEPSVMVRCDKHGARNRYGPLLQMAFPDPWIEVQLESASESAYRWRSAGHRVDIRFTVRGERFLPTALASMASKLLRELAMRAFNAYWAERVADLRRTAGYPVDARRFYAQIAPALRQLAIPEKHLWRDK